MSATLPAGAQSVLDPNDSAVGDPWHPDGSLPGDLLRFGKYPSIERWEPGDLVLTTPVKPGWISRAIIRSQASGYPTDDARWTHAAIYLGDGRSICDSDFGGGGVWGVSVKYMDEYLGEYLIRVRRPFLEDHTRWLLVVKAVAMSGRAYSFPGLVRLFVRLLFAKRKNRLDSSLSSTAVICSRLYADAYLQATRALLQDPALADTTPAFLSQTLRLVDVPTVWRPIFGCTPAETTSEKTLVSA